MEISTKNKLLKPSRVTKSPNLEVPTLDLERKTKPKIIVAIPVYNMDKVFFEQLGLPDPKYSLDVGSDSHAEETRKMLIGIAQISLRENLAIVLT